MESSTWQRTAVRRTLLALARVLINLSLSAKLLGDYGIYRTGMAGRLPWVRVPARLRRAVGWLCLTAGLAFFPAVWISGVFALRHLSMNSVGAGTLSGMLTFAPYTAICRFNRT